MSATEICRPGVFGWESGCEPLPTETPRVPPPTAPRPDVVTGGGRNPVAPTQAVTTGGEPTFVGDVLAATGPYVEPFTLVGLALALIGTGLVAMLRSGRRARS